MANQVVVEDVLAKVVQVNKTGKEGKYTVKVVQVNNKDWQISKNDQETVKVGAEYRFKLTKSEYNDKLYYWANLIKEKATQETVSSQTSETPEGGDIKKTVFSYLNSLDKDKKKAVIAYLLERI